MSHDHEGRTHNRKRLTAVLALTTVFLVAETVGASSQEPGIALADAGHMLSDVGGLAAGGTGYEVRRTASNTGADVWLSSRSRSSPPSRTRSS